MLVLSVTLVSRPWLTDHRGASKLSGRTFTVHYQIVECLAVRSELEISLVTDIEEREKESA